MTVRCGVKQLNVLTIARWREGCRLKVDAEGWTTPDAEVSLSSLKSDLFYLETPTALLQSDPTGHAALKADWLPGP